MSLTELVIVLFLVLMMGVNASYVLNNLDKKINVCLSVLLWVVVVIIVLLLE